MDLHTSFVVTHELSRLFLSQRTLSTLIDISFLQATQKCSSPRLQKPRYLLLLLLVLLLHERSMSLLAEA